MLIGGAATALTCLILLTFEPVGASSGTTAHTSPAATSPAPAAPDPSTPGPHAVSRIDYDAGAKLIVYRSEDDGRTGAYPEELRGSIHQPIGGNGPFPLIALVHGRHSTCRIAEAEEELISPCPETAGSERVDSYRGYDYLAQNLASHGYVVVSVSANGTNAYDARTTNDAGMNGRAQVLAATLDAVRAWNGGPGPSPVDETLVGRVDLNAVGLMGHSRGAEAVTHFIGYNARRTDGPRYLIRAVLALAGIDFLALRPAGVAFATVLPTCDGDVSWLDGAGPFERGKLDSFPRVQWAISGANHNWFNTVWTNDDASEGTSSTCRAGGAGSTRLSAPDQRRIGLTLMSAFLRRYVGGESVFEPLITAAAQLPASACPGSAAPCADLVRTSYFAGAEHRRPILALQTASKPLHRTTAGGKISVEGLSRYAVCDPTRASTDGACPDTSHRSQTRQMLLAWDRPARLRAEMRGAATAADDLDALTMRVAMVQSDPRNEGVAAQDFDVALTDRSGRSAAVRAGAYTRSLSRIRDWAGYSEFLPPIDGVVVYTPPAPHVILGDVRIPLARFSGVDLRSLDTLELRFGTATPKGSLYLADVLLQGRAGHGGLSQATDAVTYLPAVRNVALTGPASGRATGPFTISWTRPAGTDGPDVVQESSASCSPLLDDGAELGMGMWKSTVSGTGASHWATTTGKPSHEGTAFATHGTETAVDASADLTLNKALMLPLRGHAVLTFADWSLNEGDDYTYVQVSTDGGSSWDTLFEQTRSNYAVLAAYAHQTEVMTRRMIDLWPYAGRAILLRFRYQLGRENRLGSTPFGWYVDDIRVDARSWADVATTAVASHRVAKHHAGSFCYRVRTTFMVAGRPQPGTWSAVTGRVFIAAPFDSLVKGTRRPGGPATLPATGVGAGGAGVALLVAAAVFARIAWSCGGTAPTAASAGLRLKRWRALQAGTSPRRGRFSRSGRLHELR